MPSQIESFQDAVADAVGTVPAIAALVAAEKLAILTERGPDIENKIEEAIARLGLLILIGAPVLSTLGESSTPLPRYRCECPIFIAEQPTLNASGTTMLEVLEHALTHLHQAIAAHPGRSRLWRIDRAEPAPDPEVHSYTLTLSTTLFFS